MVADGGIGFWDLWDSLVSWKLLGILGSFDWENGGSVVGFCKQREQLGRRRERWETKKKNRGRKRAPTKLSRGFGEYKEAGIHRIK